KNDLELARICAQRMITVGSNKEIEKEEIRKATLELAHYHLENTDLEKAQKFAADYQLLYPGTPEAKDAAYIDIQAHFLSTLSPDRDQTKTRKTIESSQNFKRKYKD